MTANAEHAGYQGTCLVGGNKSLKLAVKNSNQDKEGEERNGIEYVVAGDLGRVHVGDGRDER